MSIKILVKKIIAIIAVVYVLTDDEKHILLNTIMEGISYKEAEHLLDLLEKAKRIEASKKPE